MTDELIVFLIIAIRLALPLLIPIFPLPTILSLLVLDAADQSILQKTTDLSLDDYQGYDKALDIWYLAMAYLATIRTWTDDPAQHVGAFLWYYRLVGVVAFELLGYRWLLMVFPNTFDYRTPVWGFTPPSARVAAMTARSRALTRTEHCIV